MPSHIYIRTGDYDKAAQSNVNAIVADREYIQKSGANGVYPMMYYNHNIHFLAAANAMKGRYADALKSATELEANVAPHLKAMPILEMFAPYRIVTLVRFGKWDEIAKLEKPDEALKITNVFRHFARGMAFAATNKISDAENELKLLQSVARTVPADAPFGNSGAAAVLKVADQMLAGKIALARGDKKATIETLNKAVEAEDATGYNEPPDWDLPARELLGGALLLHNENAEAERVFRAEIAKHPRNGRALFGLVESLKRQNKTSSAQMVEREFKDAWQTADTQLRVEDLAGMSLKDDKAATNQTTQRTGDVKLKTGVRIRYVEQGDPNGTPVIMLHGYTDSSYSYSRVSPLMNAKYRVFALDQRGHGDSDRPASGYKFADFAADVIAFMDAKRLQKVVIVGHSMGSFVAQQIAVTAPERVEKLVFIGSATTVRNAAVLDLQKAVNELKDSVPNKFARDFQYSVVHQSPPDEFMNRVVAESMKVPARVWRDTMTGMLAGDAKSQLGKIKAPTLVVWGDRETVFPRAEQDALVAAIPNAVLKVYAETGHSPQWERPEQFVRDFEDFVNP
jgi:pimeloyl-ACP methyl ester carboxylesterase